MERARNTKRIQRRWEKRKKGREREKACARAAHNYRLYFQIAACELAASSNCSRHWIFIARAIPSWHSTTRSECQLSTGQILVIIDMERTGRYAFVLNPFRRNDVVRHRFSLSIANQNIWISKVHTHCFLERSCFRSDLKFKFNYAL